VSTAAGLLALQSQLGNRVVQRMIEDSRRAGRPGAAIQRAPANNGSAKQELQPRLGGQAISDMKRLKPVLDRYQNIIDQTPFERELKLGGLMSRLLQLQPGYKMAAIKQFFDKGKGEAGFDPARFSGVTIKYNHKEYTPQEWYPWIDKHRAIAAADKQAVKVYIYSAYYLRAVRDAIAAHKSDLQSLLHRAPLGLDYGQYYAFRLVLKCLSARMPGNVNFDESQWGERLLKMTRGKLNKANMPPYVEPEFPLPKQEIPLPILYKQVTGRSLFVRAEHWKKLGSKPDQEAFEEWGNTAQGSSLIYTVLSARQLYPKMWDKELASRDVTLNELQSMVKKQKAWLRKNI
jgi:hypothetical protein